MTLSDCDIDTVSICRLVSRMLNLPRLSQQKCGAVKKIWEPTKILEKVV